MSLFNITPNKQKALFLAKRQLPELVCDAVNLEGINFTIPEVQTLLDGVTIGGHKLTEQNITLNQAEAWRYLFELIAKDKFTITKKVVCDLHAIAAHEESLIWGSFRDGNVTISGTNYIPPKASQLDQLWNDMLRDHQKIKSPFEQAVFVFLQMARIQFFYDVNKRMGRFMMNGLLLSQGYPAINLPAKRQLEFNELMLEFYQSNDTAPMTTFMLSCLDKQIIEIMSTT
ncbi:MAG: Fic family protein [Gammaproteobacteria bacterium]|nr:Fic family protein [Gammaproteobacteria bacterium]